MHVLISYFSILFCLTRVTRCLVGRIVYFGYFLLILVIINKCIDIAFSYTQWYNRIQIRYKHERLVCSRPLPQFIIENQNRISSASFGKQFGFCVCKYRAHIFFVYMLSIGYDYNGTSWEIFQSEYIVRCKHIILLSLKIIKISYYFVQYFRY